MNSRRKSEATTGHQLGRNIADLMREFTDAGGSARYLIIVWSSAHPLAQNAALLRDWLELRQKTASKASGAGKALRRLRDIQALGSDEFSRTELLDTGKLERIIFRLAQFKRFAESNGKVPGQPPYLVGRCLAISALLPYMRVKQMGTSVWRKAWLRRWITYTEPLVAHDSIPKKSLLVDLIDALPGLRSDRFDEYAVEKVIGTYLPEVFIVAFIEDPIRWWESRAKTAKNPIYGLARQLGQTILTREMRASRTK